MIPTPYKGLQYAFSVGSQLLPAENVAGATPSSPPNDAGVRVALRLLAPPAVAPAVGGATIDFRSFTLACMLESATAVAGVKTGCTVRVKGLKGGRPVATANAKFVAGALVGPPPFAAQTLPASFRGIGRGRVRARGGGRVGRDDGCLGGRLKV